MRYILSALLLGLAACSVLAVEPGVDAGSFARFGVGARALGMGGAFVALADDGTAGYWNPAGLAGLSGWTLTGMYTDKFSQGIQYQFLSAAGSFGSLGLGVSLIRQAIEDIPFYGDGEGETFSEYQTLWMASLSFAPELEGVGMFLGGNIKYYVHEILEGKGQGLGFDLGLLVKIAEEWGGLSFGLVSRDVRGTQIRWKGTDQEPINHVPWINTFGLAVSSWEDRLRLIGDVDIAIGRSRLNRVHLGAEIWPVHELGIRGGFVRWLEDGTTLLSAGATVRLGYISLHYSFMPHPVLGPSHMFSIELTWATEEESPKVEQ